MECSDLAMVYYFLFVEGTFSVFLFPILIMNWTKRIGGCVHEDQKLGRGFSFITILVMRIATATVG